ncbi:hypothetical protein HA466_0007020 [Hirschfeldia incana]|nr:hypothetical protein HA466_0007020 [Hirschfeldia incana]
MLHLRSISAVLLVFLLISATTCTRAVTLGKSSGSKVYVGPTPCTEDDCTFVCRHPDLLPFGCPGVNCYCLEALDNP